jgi:hypothetical protein
MQIGIVVYESIKYVDSIRPIYLVSLFLYPFREEIIMNRVMISAYTMPPFNIIYRYPVSIVVRFVFISPVSEFNIS